MSLQKKNVVVDVVEGETILQIEEVFSDCSHSCF